MATVPNFALLQATSGTLTTQATAFIVTPTNTTTAGSGMYFYVWNTVSATNPELTSITSGGTWAKVNNSASGTTSSELWYTENATAVSSFTVTPALAITGGWCFSEFSGVLASGSLDVSTKANTSSTSWSLSTGTTGTVANTASLVIECDCQLNGGKGGSNNTPSGFTQAATAGSVATHGYMNYKIVVATPAGQSATVVGSSQSASAVTTILAVFKPVANIIQQTNTKNTASGTSITITTPLNGDSLFLMLNNVSGGAGTVTSTGASWSKIGAGTDTNCVTELWAAYNVSGATSPITLGTACVSVYTEVYGLATSPLDKSVTSHGTDTASPTAIPTGTTATTTYSPEIAIASIGSQANGKGATWSSILSGYTLLSNTSAGGTSVLGCYKILTSTTTTSTGASLSPTANINGYGTVLATFNQTQTSSFVPRRALIGVGL